MTNVIQLSDYRAIPDEEETETARALRLKFVGDAMARGIEGLVRVQKATVDLEEISGWVATEAETEMLLKLREHTLRSMVILRDFEKSQQS